MHPGKFEPSIDTDETGCLFDRRLREHLMQDVPSDEVAATEALAALRTASHGMRTGMDRWLEHHNLSEGRLGVLWRLRFAESMTLGDLAESLDVSPRNITGLVDHLELDGLVVRSPDPEDRRAVRASLSPLGRAKLAVIQKEMGNVRETIVAGFTDEELKDLRHLCLKLVRNVSAKQANKELEKV